MSLVDGQDADDDDPQWDPFLNGVSPPGPHRFTRECSTPQRPSTTGRAVPTLLRARLSCVTRNWFFLVVAGVVINFQLHHAQHPLDDTTSP